MHGQPPASSRSGSSISLNPDRAPGGIRRGAIVDRCAGVIGGTIPVERGCGFRRAVGTPAIDGASGCRGRSSVPPPAPPTRPNSTSLNTSAFRGHKDYAYAPVRRRRTRTGTRASSSAYPALRTTPRRANRTRRRNPKRRNCWRRRTSHQRARQRTVRRRWRAAMEKCGKGGVPVALRLRTEDVHAVLRRQMGQGSPLHAARQRNN